MSDLHDAAKEANVDKLRELLDAGADVSELDDYNFTPLSRAATANEGGNKETVAIGNQLREAGYPRSLERKVRHSSHVAAEEIQRVIRH